MRPPITSPPSPAVVDSPSEGDNKVVIALAGVFGGAALVLATVLSMKLIKKYLAHTGNIRSSVTPEDMRSKSARSDMSDLRDIPGTPHATPQHTPQPPRALLLGGNLRA